MKLLYVIPYSDRDGAVHRQKLVMRGDPKQFYNHIKYERFTQYIFSKKKLHSCRHNSR